MAQNRTMIENLSMLMSQTTINLWCRIFQSLSIRNKPLAYILKKINNVKTQFLKGKRNIYIAPITSIDTEALDGVETGALCL